ncbi:MAG: S1 RNA-binding domain-containing protein, partial [Nitrospirota bacterium]|nr:S1 RNA-binding domain-containing protein [Nitrospirota bacterium]
MSEEQKAVEPEEENFAEMLEKSMPKRSRLEPGQMVEARIVKISGEWVFLDLGGKGEGYLDKKEVLDESGQPTVKEGEILRAYFLSSKNNDMVFTTRIGSGPAVKNQLEDAWKSGVPVEGTVAKEVKGGFEVKIGALRAFCPFSLMGLRRTDDKTACLNQTYRFVIAEYNENGRNVVLSRRPILEEEERTRKAALQESLKEGMRLKGKVTSIQSFGAFVQAGGIEGLLPISELSYTRIAKVSDVLSVGQEIEVVLKRM